MPDPDPPAIPTTIGLVTDMKPVYFSCSSHNDITRGKRERESSEFGWGAKLLLYGGYHPPQNCRCLNVHFPMRPLPTLALPLLCGNGFYSTGVRWWPNHTTAVDTCATVAV